MHALIDITKGEPQVRALMASAVMFEALATNGFHEGLLILTNASGEKLSPAEVAQAVERARLG